MFPSYDVLPVLYIGSTIIVGSRMSAVEPVRDEVVSRGSKGLARGAMPPPKGLTKMKKKWPNLQHFALLKKKFSRGHAPDPPNSLICSDFFTLTAAGPHQCERLEPPVALFSMFST